VGLFWIAGLLLSFTPCVLPMVPILSSLIAGQKTQLTRRQGFTLAASYSLGMAIVYAGFGVLAGLAGEGLAAALQNPWVLGAFALMLFLLALSMFDVYQLQVPASIQSKTTELANRLPGGNLIGVFVMGGISALVVGPCVAAPLAGALVYISQTRDVMLGGAALFAMALGMSVPLLLVGMSAGTLLPRAGAWMEYVKQFFGMMLIAVALWIVSPVLPAGVNILLWALLLLFAASLLGAFQGSSTDSASGHGAKLIKTLGLASAVMAGILLVSAASGGQSLLQPLAHLKYVSQTSDQSRHGLDFQRIASNKELDTELATAQKQGKAVMLDFYADWCVACKEYDALTFSNSQVQSRLKNVKLLQVDVTKNNAEDKALLKRFSLFGPPGIVFFKANGAVTPSYKVVGFESTEQFMSSLDKAL
jgi:thioredoxin:protein disulfide reductase